MPVRPLLLLDVDGPLNPYAAKPTRRPPGYRTYRMRPGGWDDPKLKPLRVWLNPDHGPRLLALPYDLVWATTWRGDANIWIGPALGLPELPFIDWPDTSAAPEELHWKTQAAVDWAGGRAFAFVDDELSDADRDYVAAHHAGPALLLTIDPGIGLLPEDFARLTEWARQSTN
jgi:hypothetical protein